MPHPLAPAGRDVASVTAKWHAFTAVTRSGTVVTWGLPEDGGDTMVFTFTYYLVNPTRKVVKRYAKTFLHLFGLTEFIF